MKDSNDSQVRPSASALSPSKSGDSLQSIRAATKEFCRRLKGSAGQKTVLTGFGELDAATGGLLPGSLVVVGARPGMGKTAFALNIALHAALREEKTVAIFSLEMSEEELVQRLIASGAETDVKCLGAASLTETERARVNAFAEELCNTDNILIDDTAVQSVGSIQAQCRRAAARSQKPDLIVIDYLQLLHPEYGQAESRDAELVGIVRGFKLLARETDCPVMVLSQVSRKPEDRPDKRPRLSDLRGCGSIEQEADMVLMLHRPSYYDGSASGDAGQDPAEEAKVIIAKHRNGGTREVTLDFMRKYAAFRDPAAVGNAPERDAAICQI